MAEKKKKLSRRSVVKYNLWLFKKVWKYTPSYIIGMVIEGVLWGINNAIDALYLKLLFDKLGSGEGFEPVAKIIISYAVYLSVFWIFHNWYWQIFNPRVREKLHIRMHSDMFTHAVKMDLANYDDPEFYNDFIWSMHQSFNHVTGAVEDTGKLINRIIASTTLTGILLSVDVTLAIIIFSVSVVRIVLSLLANKNQLKYNDDLNPLTRKDAYIKRVFKLPDYAKELRTTRVKENLLIEHTKNTKEKERVIKKYGTKTAVIYSVIWFLNNATTIGLMVLMLYKVMVVGSLALGGLAVAVNSVWRMSWLLSDLVDRLTKYHEHGIFIEKMIKFMECEPTVTDGELEAEEFRELTFKNVGFSYVKDAKKALDGIDLTVRKGEKIAIVGYNGAGKTTLTKLIMRLYDPTVGEILYNGRNMREYTQKSLRGRMAAVFQDYRIFASTVAENVAGGEYGEDDRQRIEDALEKSAFSQKLSTLESGIDTVLTREFDKNGTQLSGGESQKIAIARAFYKSADLMILDEPSSALDPDAEYELNRSIAHFAENKTVIFISHRLSTTRHADRIYMFDGGALIECGTHEQLMAMGGKYAYMFDLQAKRYRQEQEA